jgi:hypothetical protein
MSNVSSALHHNDILFSKGERLFRGISKAFKQGEHPQEENGLMPLMSKGEK